MKYLLAPLLKIREKRRDEAEERLAQARSALAQREQEKNDRERELENYCKWCEKESNRLYNTIQQKAVAHHDIMAIREQIGWNRGRTLTFQNKVAEAEKAVQAARAEESAADLHLQETTRHVMKIQEHKASWTSGQMALATTAEEDEMEEAATSRFLRSRILA